jgi:hypothetical protein
MKFNIPCNSFNSVLIRKQLFTIIRECLEALSFTNVRRGSDFHKAETTKLDNFVSKKLSLEEG